MDNVSKMNLLINSTAGAVPVLNDKGEVYMQKVKVARYVTGKRPDFAPSSDDSDGSDGEFVSHQQLPGGHQQPEDDDSDAAAELTARQQLDPRLQRLQQLQRPHGSDSDDSDDSAPRRPKAPQVLDSSSDESSDAAAGRGDLGRRRRVSTDDESDSSEEELDDDQVLRRRQMLRDRALAKAKKEEELMEVEEEKSEGEDEAEEFSSEYEEYTDSEEETGPRLKPVFVRKQDRVTVQEKEKEALRQKVEEAEAKKLVEERRRDTLKLVESEIRREQQHSVGEDPSLDINTDDDNDEAAYELWKLRELKRIKRDKEEREALEKERSEMERMRLMTEEERRAELRNNPKQMTNRAAKGKYKFMQKYYHRGAFYLDEEENVLKRDASGATLEDKFDKTVLPKVMQVKNFGRSGRTKYTHLVDQDTTAFDAAWALESGQNAKFFATQAAGMRQHFERPSKSKHRPGGDTSAR